MGEKTVTVSVRGVLLAAVVALALLSAYLVGNAGNGGTPAQAAAPVAPAADTHRRTLTMAGTGEGIAVPDQLSFDLAVGLMRPDLDTALADTSRVMDRVLASLEGLGVAKGDVQTTGLSMYPVYDYHQYSPPTIRGYRVSQRATVLVKELKQGGRAVSTAVATGGNVVQVSNIRLRVGDPDAAMKKARDAAVAEARTKAEQYAAAAGQELGRRGHPARGQRPPALRRGGRLPAPGRPGGHGPRRDEADADPDRQGRADGDRAGRLAAGLNSELISGG